MDSSIKRKDYKDDNAMSRNMRKRTIQYVRPTKAQISLRIRAV